MTDRTARLRPLQALLQGVFLVAVPSFAAIGSSEPTMEPSLAQRLYVERANRWLSENDDAKDVPKFAVSRPYAEYEAGSFLLIAASSAFNSLAVTTRIAANLPRGVKLVVLASGAIERATAKRRYRQYLTDDRLTVIDLGTETGLWARDSLPIPVWMQDRRLGLVDARYYHGHEPDELLAQAFRSPLLRHRYYFEGGNLLTDSEGHCFVVANRNIASMPDSAFERYYGCRRLTRLEHVAGIGHVDERIKIVGGKRVLTDEPRYEQVLRDAGYEVTLLPRPMTRYGTYANALLLNGTVYMPSYGEAGDAEAEALYRELGFHVVPVPSTQLSSRGKGSVHCITMVYPHVPEAELLQRLRQSLR
jgi:hypothetical protein